MLLTGEPGIGKSRLTRALIESVDGEPHRRLRYFCSPHHTDSALHPVIAQIERAAGFERGDDAATRLDKLQAMLAYLATPRTDAALIADLLSIEGAEARWPRPDLAPPQRKQRTLDALRRTHRGAGRAAADPRRLRGRALDRPDQPRAARPHDRRPASGCRCCWW